MVLMIVRGSGTTVRGMMVNMVRRNDDGDDDDGGDSQE